MKKCKHCYPWISIAVCVLLILVWFASYRIGFSATVVRGSGLNISLGEGRLGIEIRWGGTWSEVYFGPQGLSGLEVAKVYPSSFWQRRGFYYFQNQYRTFLIMPFWLFPGIIAALAYGLYRHRQRGEQSGFEVASSKAPPPPRGI